MKILQINSVVGFGSTGKIMFGIHKTITKSNGHGYMAYGRFNTLSPSDNQKTIKIGGIFSVLIHVVISRLFDRHGLGSKFATLVFIKKIVKLKPDLIHLHNIHGYFLNYPILFNFLSSSNIPVVWTFHDNWPFTGHCSYFDDANCIKWKTECKACPLKTSYPKSLLFDSSNFNFRLKKKLFLNLPNLTIVTPSKWLEENVRNSFLKNKPLITINNGINLNLFKPQSKNIFVNPSLKDKFIVLCVANYWTNLKGLHDIIKLSQILPKNIQIVMIGVTNKLKKKLPRNILSVNRTNSSDELAQYYSSSDVFLNPTFSDNFPTTNLEALACGIPVITYQTGGSPESIDERVGLVVNKGDLNGLVRAISEVKRKGKLYYKSYCLEKAKKYDQDHKFSEYFELYKSILKLSP
jgi:glycosyltransferase involved in cell wall biosynthesis